jgi:hypothetical protein
MKNFLFSLLACLFFLSTFNLFCQTPKDSCLKMHLVCMQMSGQQPGGDLAKRFGVNLNVGLSYFFKTRKNILFGIDPHFFFGRNIKEDVLAPIKTPEGTVTNTDGNFANLKVNQRGWLVTASGGKILHQLRKKKIAPNPNSGILLMAGIGYIQHRIFILDQERNVPQVSSSYLKGYDRLTAGICLKEFIGYTILSNNRLLNFFGGFEFYQGFTKSMRTYNYDTMESDTSLHKDLLFGFRVGWILPIYKRVESDNLFTY